MLTPAGGLVGRRGVSGRILLATDRAVPGGAQLALAELAPALARRGWTVEALVGEPGPLVDRFRADGIATTISADVDAGVLADLAPDVLLSMGAGGHAWAGPAAADAAVPAVWWLELTLRGRPAEAAALAVPAVVAATLTETAAAALRDRAPDLAVEVIAPGVHPDLLVRGRLRDPAAARARLGMDLPPSTALLVMVARLDPIKGQDIAIDAVAQLVDDGHDIHLALVGGAHIGHEGNIAERLRDQADARGVGERVTHAGFAEDPSDWHAAADVAVHASRHEAFGLTLVEALAHGSPVVASDTDGPRSILDGGRYGLLTEPGDVDALAAALARVLDDEPRRRRMSAMGPGRAAAFTSDAAAARWDAVLRRVLPTSSGPGG